MSVASVQWLNELVRHWDHRHLGPLLRARRTVLGLVHALVEAVNLWQRLTFPLDLAEVNYGPRIGIITIGIEVVVEDI